MSKASELKTVDGGVGIYILKKIEDEYYFLAQRRGFEVSNPLVISTPGGSVEKGDLNDEYTINKELSEEAFGGVIFIYTDWDLFNEEKDKSGKIISRSYYKIIDDICDSIIKGPTYDNEEEVDKDYKWTYELFPYDIIPLEIKDTGHAWLPLNKTYNIFKKYDISNTCLIVEEDEEILPTIPFISPENDDCCEVYLKKYIDKLYNIINKDNKEEPKSKHKEETLDMYKKELNRNKAIYGPLSEDIQRAEYLNGSIFKSLTHLTTSKNLIEILKSKFLYTKNELFNMKGNIINTQSGGIYNGEWDNEFPGFYLSINYLDDVFGDLEGEVKIICSLDILKQNNYHINEDDSNGIINSKTITPDYIYLLERHLLQKVIDKKFITDNEVVFHDKISIDAIKDIIVYRSSYNKLVKIFEENNLQEYIKLLKFEYTPKKYIDFFEHKIYDKVVFFTPLDSYKDFLNIRIACTNANISFVYDDNKIVHKKLVEEFKKYLDFRVGKINDYNIIKHQFILPVLHTS